MKRKLNFGIMAAISSFWKSLPAVWFVVCSSCIPTALSPSFDACLPSRCKVPTFALVLPQDLLQCLGAMKRKGESARERICFSS